MIKRFKTKFAELGIWFKLNDNGMDMVRFTVIPTTSVPYNTENGKKYRTKSDMNSARSFELYVNAGKFEDRTNLRDVRSFIGAVTEIIEKGDGKRKYTYIRKVDNKDVRFVFGMSEFTGEKTFNISVWYGDEKNKPVFTFTSMEDVEEMVKILATFTDTQNQIFMHTIVDNLKDAIRDGIGEQLKYIVEDVINKNLQL